jgi:hypothetical protein
MSTFGKKNNHVLMNLKKRDSKESIGIEIDYIDEDVKQQ